ncbi:hypothetical protein EON83_30400 [bacterium]|nr:MAG: hypothetical protein EON83_30400 [bacterium]
MNQQIPTWLEKTLLIAAAVVVPLFILAGTTNPWTHAKKALANYGSGPYVVVGGSYKYSYSDLGTREVKSRTYVVIGHSPRNLSTYTVISKNGAVSVEEMPYGLAMAVFGYSVFYSIVGCRIRALTLRPT